MNSTIPSHRLSSNLGQVRDTIDGFLQKNESAQTQDYFQKGLSEGQKMSSAEARALRESYAKLDYISKANAKKLCRAGVHPKDIENLGKDKDQIEKVADLWELGYLLHDMQTSARQAAHVIQSIRSVGVSNQHWAKDVEVNKTIHEALAILRSITKNMEVECNLDEELPHTEACQGELVQIWINLVKNAAESLSASKTENPKITVKSSTVGKRIRVTISDNGPGIPKDLYEKVFQPNFSTKVGGLSFGLGLGLTIVKRIINEHDGSIDLVSQPAHTEFTVYLPIVS